MDGAALVLARFRNRKATSFRARNVNTARRRNEAHCGGIARAKPSIAWVWTTPATYRPRQSSTVRSGRARCRCWAGICGNVRRPRDAMSQTRKLAAILVADIVGFSRLAGADEERTLARVRGLRSDLIEPTIAVHRGRVVKRPATARSSSSVASSMRCAAQSKCRTAWSSATPAWPQSGASNTVSAFA